LRAFQRAGFSNPCQPGSNLADGQAGHGGELTGGQPRVDGQLIPQGCPSGNSPGPGVPCSA
jgi:hypothetical protein